MRCREIRRRLIAHGGRDSTSPPDAEVLAHLEQCPRCARDAEVMKLLGAITAAAGEDERQNMAPLGMMRDRVEQRTAAVSQRGVTRRRPVGTSLVFAGAAVVIALFIAAKVFLPAGTENHIIGYEVAFAGVERDVAEDTESICYMLWTLELPEANIDEVTCDTTCRVHIVYLQSPEEAARVIEAFSRLDHAYHSAEIIPVRARGAQNPSG
jgi:hypothetical protein